MMLWLHFVKYQNPGEITWSMLSEEQMVSVLPDLKVFLAVVWLFYNKPHWEAMEGKQLVARSNFTKESTGKKIKDWLF